MPAFDRSHYAGAYKARRDAVLRAARADPATCCWRCGLTLAQAQLLEAGQRVVWHAGHTVDGDSRFPLAAEHSTCNQRAGQAHGQAKRLMVSRRWR